MGNRSRQAKNKQKDPIAPSEKYFESLAKRVNKNGSNSISNIDTLDKNGVNIPTTVKNKNELRSSSKKNSKILNTFDKQDRITTSTTAVSNNDETNDEEFEEWNGLSDRQDKISDAFESSDSHLDSVGSLQDCNSTNENYNINSVDNDNDSKDDKNADFNDNSDIGTQDDLNEWETESDSGLKDEYSGSELFSGSELQDDDDQVLEMFQDSENDDSEVEFEKEAKLQKIQDIKDKELGEKEFQESKLEQQALEFPKDDEQVDIALIYARISQLVTILSNFGELNKSDRSRSDHVQLLLEDLSLYYGYNLYLCEKLFHLFPITEIIEFFESNQVQRPVVIRTNTLKTRRKDLAQQLISRGVSLEPLAKWSKVGIQIFDSPVPIGATPEYLAGHYMLQAASSFLPVMALEPQAGEFILDMCAAPGGKTSYIAAEMKNQGVLIANDISKERLKSLVANCHRLGVKNIVALNYCGKQVVKVVNGFDRVLLDAPCSGTGVISKDTSVKTNKDQYDFQYLTHLQKELILSAIDSLKPDGVLVYSTCSITVDENETVVDYALRKRPNIKIVDSGLEFGTNGFVNYRGAQFHPSLSKSKRYYPHTHNMDGFFVVKLEKHGHYTPKSSDAENEAEKDVKKRLIESVGFDDNEDAGYLRGRFG